MQAGADFPILLALLSGMEVVTILAIVLVLFGSRYFSDLGRGVRKGTFYFRDALDQQAEDAGRSVGANYGKPALDALTHDNRAVEFHDHRELGPVNFRLWRQRAKNRLIQLSRSVWTRLKALLHFQ